MMIRKLPAVVLAALFCFSIVACGGDEQARNGGKTRVVATYSILGDLVKNVGGDRVELTTLVGSNGDAHTFEPAPSDNAKIADADVVFENGLEFETWLDDLYESSGSEARRVVVSEGIDPLPIAEEGHEHGAEERGAEEEHEHGAAEEASARLLVADGERPRVAVVDTGSGENLASYGLEANASMHSTHEGRYGFAVQSDGDLVNAVDGGVWAEEHGDHSHSYAEEPRMLDFELTGQEPVHFVAHEGQVAVFNDGDGSATVFEEAEVEDADAERFTIESGRAHHGVAVPMGDRVIVSRASEEEEGDLPSTLSVYDLKGNRLQDFRGCGGMHGEVSFEETAAFACEDGVVLLERRGDGFSQTKIPYPDGTTEETRSWTLLGDEEVPYLVGDSGDDGLMRVDVDSGEMERLPLPGEVADFALDPETGHAVALTTDGRLHSVEPESGEVEASAGAIRPFEIPEEFGPPVPYVSVGHGVAYVSEPETGEVAEVHLEDMAVENTFDVGGTPTDIAVLGGEATEHEHGEEASTGIELVANREELAQEEHEEGEHGHEHGEYDPHVWHDPNNATAMVESVRDALTEADPQNARFYERNAEEYIGDLEALDAEVRDQVDSIPQDNRTLFTSHDTFGYFAERYGFGVDTALASASTEASDPSAGETAELVEEIESSGVPAIFAENVSNPAVMENIAGEAGVELAPTLYTDALGEPGSEGGTYVEMVRYNATTIAEALR